MPDQPMKEPQIPEALRDNVGFLLAWLSRKSRQTFIEDLEPHGLRPAYYGVLALLDAQETASQQQLGDWLGIDRSNMVALLDDLEERGFVVRAVDPGDRRRHAVRLTEAGRGALQQIHEVVKRATPQYLAPLTPAEQAELVRLLTKLLAARLAP